jgi:predicted nucleotidyltransferase component of viral defense system
MYILQRYFNERLLYRVSVSKYCDNFLLKGGSLLYAHNGLNCRPTVDVDFMASRISRDQDELVRVFKEILSIVCMEDGVEFDIVGMNPTPIAVDKKYPGVRLPFKAKMDTIVHEMSIDIGFGDIVTPAPVELEYPVLLERIPEVKLMAYSLETVVAEKFHAMIDRDETNSRMKDFFDVYQIFKAEQVDEDVLAEAIRNTFHNREISYHEGVHVFLPEFATDEMRVKRWKKFLKDIKYAEELPFEEVMAYLKEKLEKYWSEDFLNE